MISWKFSVYVSVNAKSDVQDVVDEYSLADSIAFSRAVEHLAITPRGEWNEPHAKDVTPSGKKYKSAGFKLYEIRYKANKRQERALGYFPERIKTFVILLICNHKGTVYAPANSFKIAFNRFEAISNGQASHRTLQIDGEDFPQDEEE